MENVNRTLYIPLYGKAQVSRKGLFLRDEMAETIWEAEAFPLKGKAKSKWLCYNMGMRSAVFDRWLEEKLTQLPDAVVLHIGCGLDSRMRRVDAGDHLWFDLDFPEVMAERKKYFRETETYRMLSGDAREGDWLSEIPGGVPGIVVMEGVSMYLRLPELQQLLKRLHTHFSQTSLLMDVYTVFAAKATKYKNPINEVGVTQVYGLDSPEEVTAASGLRFVTEHDLTPEDLIRQLPKREQGFFRVMFGGSMAKKIYRLYELEGKSQNLPENN
ncbi:MAG: class I SAM-dependent methyltransferase [Oscillospiraceae bacterium]|nr:class I SAM-dependent methyltransferase [Oscillospiraceae bacterium]